MRSLFNSPYRVTQKFGVRPEYYSKFSLSGHEGLDIIPTSSDWTILCLEDGVVVLDDDIVGSVSADPYGKIVTVWHPEIKCAIMYCHLSENFVVKGQTVKKGEKIGTMGATGNVDGAHLHLNLFEVDDNGIRLNRDNGYLGGIDPLPFLQEEETVSDNISIDTEVFEELVRKSSAFDEVLKSLELPDDATNDTVARSIAATRGLVSSLQKEVATAQSEVNNRIEQLANERADRQRQETISSEAIKLEKQRYTTLESSYIALKMQWESTRKEFGTVRNELASCQSQRPYCSRIGRLLGLCK